MAEQMVERERKKKGVQVERVFPEWPEPENKER
jgi:hypothetical protein